MSKATIASIFVRAANLLDEPHLNSTLCLIFNGIASIIAIIFLVLFFGKSTASLLGLGIAGCICMVLANITDLLPSGLNKIARKISKKT